MTSADSPNPAHKIKNKPQRIPYVINAISLLLAIVSILAVSYVWPRLERSLSNVNNHVTALQQALMQFEKEVEQNTLKTQTVLSTNQKNLSQLMSQSGDTSGQQAMAESAYLIRLAHLHLTLDNNTNLAIQLLKMASERIDTITSSLATRLKIAIAHDIATLSAIPQIDVPNLMGQLDQVSAQIAALPIRPKNSSPAATTPASLSFKADTWWDHLKGNLAGLKKLFVVRYFDNSIEPLLTPAQSAYLKENIQLKIYQAQWAILHHSERLYRESLTIAVQWLNQYGDNDPAVEKITTKLQSFSLIDITPQIPSTLESFDTLTAPTSPHKDQTNGID